MQQETLYLKLDRNVEIKQDDVRIKDLGSLFCREETLLCKIKTMKVYTFHPGDGGRKVVSVMHLIALIQKEFPALEVENVGETEIVLERVETNTHKGPMQAAKICFVSCICFFGAAFTIMAFHNDISIVKVFEKIYEMITGLKSDGYGVLEISYSIGLALGIIVFFNHIGNRRITKDPTPIEVEMRLYEDEVNNALVETADREGKTLDVE